jgi:hypothetical protein
MGRTLGIFPTGFGKVCVFICCLCFLMRSKDLDCSSFQPKPNLSFSFDSENEFP